MIILPRKLKCGQQQAASVTLFAAQGLAQGPVTVKLMSQSGEKLGETSSLVSGKAKVPFDVPKGAGEYKVVVKGPGFKEQAQVEAVERFPVFLQTNKPIYKPGQTVHIRVITLNGDLRPHPAEVEVTIQEAKGSKVAHQTLKTDEYGMATFDLPLSTEPNLGKWKITAKSGENSTELDFEVAKYTLPKYEVKTSLDKDWYLASEPIQGEVTAEYSFGKKVKGTLRVVAKRYVGQWEKYARFEDEIDGKKAFELPATGYVAGVPAAKGMGNVQLEVVVEEQATGYQQKITKLLTISQAPLTIKAIPESSTFKPGLPFNFLIVTETPVGEGVDTVVETHFTFQDEEFKVIKEETSTTTRLQVSN